MPCLPSPSSNDPLLDLAARNIALEIGDPPAKQVLLVYSTERSDLAERIAAQISARGLALTRLELIPGVDPRSMIEEVAGNWGLVLLFQPKHAHLLFEVVGRPDVGMLIPNQYLFCDWLIRPASLIRLYGIDMEELRQFRQALVTRLSVPGEIHITSWRGTDITVRPREWILTNGEVFTAPLEGLANGVIHVDGCAYGGPPAAPFDLIIEAGRVANLTDLDQADEQQWWVYNDLSYDENASVLAELGIGINPGARWEEDLMESEQARGTCHFGFGNNLMYGGQNRSSIHFDLVICNPTIEAGGKILCKAGEHLWKP